MYSFSVVRWWRVVIALGLVAVALIVSGSAEASTAICQRTQTPNVGSGPNELRGVAITSSRNAWAVGYYYNGTEYRTLVEHWNGSVWTIQASPNPRGSSYSELSGVAATSSRNAWAVGYYDHFGRKTLIEHWNGSTWKIQPGPALGRGQLLGVAATSSTNAWAVGHDRNGALIEHWNGRAWKIETSPRGRGYSELLGVTATTSRNAWAVGYYDHSGHYPLIEHWNGRVWKIQASTNPRDSSYSELSGVAASSSTSAWTVGYSSQQISADSFAPVILIEHWSGRTWEINERPNDPVPISKLAGVAASSSTNIWAVGGALIEHWNGTAWKARLSPGSSSNNDTLYGVAAKSSTSVWAVGSYSSVSSNDPKSLALHCG